MSPRIEDAQIMQQQEGAWFIHNRVHVHHARIDISWRTFIQ
jgi:hypothetical protein